MITVTGYWNARAATYAPDDTGAPGRNLLHWLAECGHSDDAFLEVGSGNGRIYELVTLWRDCDYQMCDISQAMIEKLQERTGQTATLWDGETLPYEDGAFDWALSYAVLLHVPPAMIKQVVAEHARVSRRWVFVNTAAWVDGPLAGHCFNHDYAALFKAAGLRVWGYRYFDDTREEQWLLRA